MSEHHTSNAVSGQHISSAQHTQGVATPIVLWLLLATTIIVTAWRLSGQKKRESERLKRAMENAAKEKQLRNDLAAQAIVDRQRLEQSEYYRQLKIWQEAERAADNSYPTSILLHPNEILGYATAVERIVTHKVGHKSDRVSTRTGSNAGQTESQSNSGSSNAGFGIWGSHESTSDARSSGLAKHTSEHTSSGEGHTYSKDDIRTEIVDRGQLIITNLRVVFQGDNASLEIPTEKIIGFHFRDDARLVIDYPKRLNGECYAIPDVLAMKIAVTKRLKEPGFEVTPPIPPTF